MPLFVVLREGLTLDDAVKAKIHQAIRTALSPRFVPDTIEQVDAIPRTLTGKKLELPIKKLLLGQPAHARDHGAQALQLLVIGGDDMLGGFVRGHVSVPLAQPNRPVM